MKFSLLKLRKASESPAQQIQNPVSLPCLWPYRLVGNLLILAIIASVAIIIVTIRENLINRQIDAFMKDFYAYTAQYGWQIDDIIIQGRNKTTKEEIINQINLNRNDNILEVNLKEIKDKIEQLPWVESAAVRRGFFPNVLQITIVEKKVIALWQSGDAFYPVDQNGHLVEAEYTPHQPILVIVGRRAPEKINDLLAVVSETPEILPRIKAAKLYAGRRWDIIIDDIENGTTIKMPEKNLDLAWKKFININHQHGLLKRKLTFIDLRYENKIVVTVDDTAYADKNKKKHR